MRSVAAVAVVTAVLVSALAVAWFGPPLPKTVTATVTETDTATRPAWSEVAWPFAADPFGRGKAYRCAAADCGAEVEIFLRAKLGFCDCTTGVADDDDLDRMGDLVLVGEVSPLGAGRPVSVAWMKGRSRAYALNAHRKTAISVVFNDRCDMIAATAVLGHDRPADTEPRVIEFLNSSTVLRWAEITLGL
jgi:hypothetical protein